MNNDDAKIENPWHPPHTCREGQLVGYGWWWAWLWATVFSILLPQNSIVLAGVARKGESPLDARTGWIK